MRNLTFKSASVLFLVFLLAVSFVSCSSGNDEYAEYSEKIEALRPKDSALITDSDEQQGKTEKNEAPDTEEPSGDTESFVWVSATGNKYHSKPDCSGMKNPEKLHLGEAREKGYTVCKRCN